MAEAAAPADSSSLMMPQADDGGASTMSAADTTKSAGALSAHSDAADSSLGAYSMSHDAAAVSASSIGSRRLSSYKSSRYATGSAKDLTAADLENTGDHMKVEGPEEFVRNNPEYRKGYVASISAMCLGIMGGAVLPLPWTFSVTGITVGILLCLIIGAANVFTSDLLIRQCFKSGARDYEELAYATGGLAWLIITQISIIILLYGSIIAAIQQAAEAIVFALQTIWGDSVPSWLLYSDDSGYVIMVFIVLVICFPLCMVKQLRSLEYAGILGFFIVMWLTFAIIIQSIGHGLPAVGNGELRPVGFTSIDNLASAISILGFAFYVQPLMMPLLAEMPGPLRIQARILSWAMRFVVIVFAGGVYVATGFFGAAWYGEATEGNIVQNVLLGGGVPQGVLNVSIALYLAFGIPCMEFPTRMVMNNWARDLMEWVAPGSFEAHSGIVHVVVTSIILIPALMVSMFWQAGSANILVVTGATGVFMCSYVLPVVNHFLLYFGRANCQKDAEEALQFQKQKLEGSHYDGHIIPKILDGQAVPLDEALPPMGPASLEAIGNPGVLTYRHQDVEGPWGMAKEFIFELFVPALIVVVGAIASGVSLWAAFKPGAED